MLPRLVVLFAVAFPATAFAHIHLDFPANRYGDQQKAQPCGVAGGMRTANVSVFEPGETITIEWTETIDHPSHFRVSFDDDGDDDFCYPASMDDYYSCDSVVLDNIADDPAASQSIQFTFPDIECENCTLQVVQVMYDKVSTGWGDNDLYFNCADIALRAPSNDPDAGPNTPDADVSMPEPDSGSGGGGGGDDVSGGGCSMVPDGPGSRSGRAAALVLMFAVLVVLRRR